MLAPLLLGIWFWNMVTNEGKATVVANTDLRLVHVDENPRMPARATTATTVASNHSVVSPFNRLLMNQFYCRPRCGLSRQLESSFRPWLSSTHLEVEVCLLEAGTSHRFRSWLLALRPYLSSVWCLRNSALDVALCLLRESL
jgi:hypothetical protein